QAAKRVFTEVAERGGEPRNVAEALGVVQVADSGVVSGWVTEVLGAHPQEVVRYKQGETKLMPFFVGQVMKVSRGKADPKLARRRRREGPSGYSRESSGTPSASSRSPSGAPSPGTAGDWSAR